MQKKHILIVSQYFYPEPFRINDMAMEWVKRGYKVTVLTGIPNYPAGRFYDGYGYFRRRKETWNGVEIIRIPVIPRGSCAAGMAVNYLSFVVSGFFWKVLSGIKADVVFIFEVSPMTQALVGVWYGKKHHVPVYLYAQDLWPENIELITGIHNRAALMPIDKMADYIYKNTDEIFATSPGFVEAIVNRKMAVSREKVHYWPQYAEEFYRPMSREQADIKSLAQNSGNNGAPVPKIPDDGTFRIAFTGNIGYAQGLDILPKAAARLKGRDVQFVIVGEGRYQEELVRRIKGLGVLEQFLMVPRQEAERIPELLAMCDAAYISCSDPDTIPAKLQSYMACGKYVVASAGGETKRIINEADCGICVPFGSSRALAGAILRVLRNRESVCAKGSNARNYFLKNFKKSMLMDEMDLYFQKCGVGTDQKNLINRRMQMKKVPMTLEELQQIEFEILKVFRDFCKEHHLRYYLGGGTLLGAIRHKGFIPWDDDIDVMMPRPDYMRFLKLNRDGCLDRYRRLDDIHLNRNALTAVLRIYDKRTELTFTNYRIEKKFGCWIDIFPIDGLHDLAFARKIHFKEARAMLDLILCNDTKIGGKRRNKFLSYAQYCLLPVLPFVYLAGHERLIRRMDRIARRYPYGRAKYVGVLEGRAEEKEAMLKKDMEPAITVEFWGEKFYAMANYDEYLTNLYGDYMQLPPVEERVSRHEIEFYWNGKA